MKKILMALSVAFLLAAGCSGDKDKKAMESAPPTPPQVSGAASPAPQISGAASAPPQVHVSGG